MAEKPVKTKEAVKAKPVVEEKAKLAKLAPTKAVTAKAADKGKEKAQPKQPNRIVRWWRETIGELRKVSWPTVPGARRMTGIVLLVMAGTAVLLGLLDFVFSRLIGLLISL